MERNRAQLNEVKVYLNYIANELRSKLRSLAHFSQFGPANRLEKTTEILIWLTGLVEKFNDTEKLGEMFGVGRYQASMSMGSGVALPNRSFSRSIEDIKMDNEVHGDAETRDLQRQILLAPKLDLA